MVVFLRSAMVQFVVKTAMLHMRVVVAAPAPKVTVVVLVTAVVVPVAE